MGNKILNYKLTFDYHGLKYISNVNGSDIECHGLNDCQLKPYTNRGIIMTCIKHGRHFHASCHKKTESISNG